MTFEAVYGMPDLSMQARLKCALILLAISAVSTPGQVNWPELRGPERNGHAAAKKLPLVWSETNNIAWKVPVPGRGRSSPVVCYFAGGW